MTNQSSELSSADLLALIRQLSGMAAWRSKAGNGTGSIFTIEFGNPLPTIGTQGELSLMVYCAWRIVEPGHVLCSWHDDSEEIIAPNLAAIEKLVVLEANLSAWNDLNIRFINGRELQIVNDFSIHHGFDTSWFITHKEEIHYCVNSDSSLTQELINTKL